MAEEQKDTGQDLIAIARQLPATESFSLKPRTFEEAYRFSNVIAESDLVPKEFQKKPANVLVAVQLGMELGVSPMQALQSMYVINGRPSIFGDLLPAIVFASGLCEQFDEEGDDTTATCTVKRRGFKAISRTFTWEDAKRAKGYEHGQIIPLTEKQTYKSFPKRMLQMRSRAWALRDAFPDVLKGVAVYEEVQDEAPSIEIEKEPPITIPQPKQREQTLEEFKARQGEKAKADAAEPKGRGSNQVDSKAIPAQASDGVREGTGSGDFNPSFPEAKSQSEAPPVTGKSEPEKEPEKSKARHLPNEQSNVVARNKLGQILPKGSETEIQKPGDLKDEVLAWIKSAPTADLESHDIEKCYIRKVFNDKTLLERLTSEQRAEILVAFKKETQERP